MLHEKVKDFLLENKIQTFYQQELETIDTLVSLTGVHLPSPCCQEVSECNCFKCLVVGNNTMYFFFKHKQPDERLVLSEASKTTSALDLCMNYLQSVRKPYQLRYIKLD